MAATIQIPNDINVSSPLGALIAHFNASSHSVQKAFTKLFTEYTKQQADIKLKEKIEKGEQDIRMGLGISQKDGETNEAFFERLCTM